MFERMMGNRSIAMRAMRPIVATMALCLLVSPAWARVKLITLPVRERVVVQLDHPSATLVEEERVVPLVAGTNQVDFSWANTTIDPNTIVFRVLGAAEGEPFEVNVLSVSYPPGENALVWDVSAGRSGNVRVRISYLLGGLTKAFNYRAVAANDEKTLTLSQYIRVKNFANEQFDDTTIHAGFGDSFEKPIGLNETREMLVERFTDVPVEKTYTANPAEFGYLDRPRDKLNVPMHYVIKNDQRHRLGKAPLPYGKVRIFQKDSRGTAAFLGEDWGQFTPIDDEMALYLGLAQDIVVKRTLARRDRTKVGGNLSHYDVVIQYEIENFKDQPVALRIAEDVRHLAHEVGLRSGRPVEWVIGADTDLGDLLVDKTDQQRVTYSLGLPAREGDEARKLTKRLHLVLRNVWP